MLCSLNFPTLSTSIRRRRFIVVRPAFYVIPSFPNSDRMKYEESRTFNSTFHIISNEDFRSSIEPALLTSRLHPSRLMDSCLPIGPFNTSRPIYRLRGFSRATSFPSRRPLLIKITRGECPGISVWIFHSTVLCANLVENKIYFGSIPRSLKYTILYFYLNEFYWTLQLGLILMVFAYIMFFIKKLSRFYRTAMRDS